jgi:hypothetical protein
MRRGSFVSESLGGGDQMQNHPATLPLHPSASMSIGEGSPLVGRGDGNRSGDLRSTVAHRFMRMLRSHDRARLKVLATHPTQSR